MENFFEKINKLTPIQTSEEIIITLLLKKKDYKILNETKYYMKKKRIYLKFE